MTILAGVIDDSTYDQTTTVINSNEGENAKLFVAVYGGTATGMEMFLVSKHTASAIKLTLRDSTGNLLTTGTITGGTGWVPVALDTPTPIVKGESYYLGWIADQGYIKPRTDTTSWVDEYDSSSSFATPSDPLQGLSTIGKPRTALRLTGDADTLLVLDDVLVEPGAGKQFVTIVGPDLTEGSLLYGTSPSATTGDQLETDVVTDGGKTINLRPDGTLEIENIGTEVQTFQFRIYDIDGDGWSNYATATVTTVDTSPIISSIDGDNDVYPGQDVNINIASLGDTAIRVRLGGEDQVINNGATDTSIPITIGGDLPYGLHQLQVELL